MSANVTFSGSLAQILILALNFIVRWPSEGIDPANPSPIVGCKIALPKDSLIFLTNRAAPSFGRLQRPTRIRESGKTKLNRMAPFYQQ